MIDIVLSCLQLAFSFLFFFFPIVFTLLACGDLSLFF